MTSLDTYVGLDHERGGVGDESCVLVTFPLGQSGAVSAATDNDLLQEQRLASAWRRTGRYRAIEQYGQVIAVLFAERGIDVDHVTIYRWVHWFTRDCCIKRPARPTLRSLLPRSHAAGLQTGLPQMVSTHWPGFGF